MEDDRDELPVPDDEVIHIDTERVEKIRMFQSMCSWNSRSLKSARRKKKWLRRCGLDWRDFIGCDSPTLGTSMKNLLKVAALEEIETQRFRDKIGNTTYRGERTL